MPHLPGIMLALSVSGLATRIGLDRDRAFPRSGTLVVTGFLLVALIGFRKNLWLVVAALAAHGVFDIFHGRVVTNPGGPRLVAGVLLNLRHYRRCLPGVAPRALSPHERLVIRAVAQQRWRD
jgi:hypothetical protein